MGKIFENMKQISTILSKLVDDVEVILEKRWKVLKYWKILN